MTRRSEPPFVRRLALAVPLLAALATPATAHEVATDVTVQAFLKPEEKRQLVETITEKIIVGKEEVAVDLLYLPAVVGKQRGHAAADT